MSMDWLASLEHYLGWLTLISILTGVGSLLLIPFLIARLPADYFCGHDRKAGVWTVWPGIVRLVLLGGKNLLGLLLLLAGIAMLVLPGQGLLSMLLGLTLMDFPGKYRLEQRLISLEPVLRALNWVRLRSGVPPFILDKE